MTTADSTHRLPRHVLPVAYHVHLGASPRRRRFTGTLTCQLRVTERVENFLLHARDLKVSHATLAQGGQTHKLRVTYDPLRQTIALHAPAELKKGTAELSLRFAGQLNPSMHGLYLAKDGPERAIVSQCEAADARAIFPCFDEPDCKATLQWTVTTDVGLEVITNGAALKRRRQRGTPARVTHTFAPTRVIPTYLAAVAIGKFVESPTQRVAGVPCRVLCGAKKIPQTRFAQHVTQYVLPWYQKYFGQKYNYGKLDQVAVPGFDAGAMENVGAIFYRQNLLLMQEGATSWGAQKRIAEVIAHEIAHQWFGNLVTMVWWDDLWLNEAFATWIAYKVCDAWRPDWRMWDDYLESKEAALAADALHHTHPIYQEVKSPAQATELFDVITYEKGCGVLRMAESFLGEDVFRDGLRRYMAAHKNKNAQGRDLWAKLGEASGQDMLALMQGWVTQPGFPHVSVRMEAKPGKTRLYLRQRRFFSDPHASSRGSGHAGELWTIPLVIAYDGGPGHTAHRAMMRGAEATVELPTAAGHTARWAYPNADAVGFFRLEFDAPSREGLLVHGLAHLSPASKMGLITDVWAQVRCGTASVTTFCDVLQAFARETDHAVTRALAQRLHTLERHVAHDEDRAALGQFTQGLFAAQRQALGFAPAAGEAPAEGARRAVVLDVLGHIALDAEVLAEAERQLEREMRDPGAIDANLAGVWCSLSAKHGDRACLQRFLSQYQRRKRAGHAPELSSRYLYAMACFERPQIVADVLTMCLDGTIPQEQLRVMLSMLLARRTSGPKTWAFLKKNWKILAPQVGSMGLSRLVEATGALPYETYKDVASFFAKHPVPEAERALKKALEGMQLWHQLHRREAPRLSSWLRQAGYATPQ